jgi:hypothetical protein
MFLFPVFEKKKVTPWELLRILEPFSDMNPQLGLFATNTAESPKWERVDCDAFLDRVAQMMINVNVKAQGVKDTTVKLKSERCARCRALCAAAVCPRFGDWCERHGHGDEIVKVHWKGAYQNLEAMSAEELRDVLARREQADAAAQIRELRGPENPALLCKPIPTVERHTAHTA